MMVLQFLLNSPVKQSWSVSPISESQRRYFPHIISSLVSNTGINEKRWNARWCEDEWLIMLDGKPAGVTLTVRDKALGGQP